MFKALILTQKIIKHPHSTLNRQIISQIKEQIEYSPIKSPQKLQEISKTKQTHVHTKINEQSRWPFPATQIEGKFKLFHQYQMQKVQDNFNNELIDKKKQQIATLSHIKTNILAIMNISLAQDKQKVLTQLSQAKDEIQAVDIFTETIHSGQNIKTSEQKTYNLVVYFKNSLMCEEFYKYCYRECMLLPVYLKQVVILERSTSEEMSYKEIIAILHYIEPKFQKQSPFQSKQKEFQQFQKQYWQWIELPKCVNCLLKLQFQVSGIDQKILYLIDESKNQENQQTKPQPQKLNTFDCSVCKILEQHRKQTDIHRKLSYQDGYQDHYKSQKHAHCQDCKQNSDIWICMICGSVGCGRYKNADAYKHFVKSGHIITIDLETQRVWNYLSDCFSHKLLQSFNQPKSSVRFPEINNEEGEKIENSKLEAAFWQYCSVFSQEMQRQRIFYDNIKKSEQEKFQLQDQKLEMIIKQLEKENQEKSLQLKRSLKKKSKLSKKQKDLEDKVSEQRQILKQQEECLSADFVKNLLQNDEDIIRRKNQLQALEVQLNQLLVELSTN